MAGAAEDLAAQIRDDITAGKLPDGAKLPSIGEYIKQGHTKSVAERAMGMLRAEGLVISRHGAGFYVQKSFARIRRVSPGRLSKAQWGSGQAIQDHDTGKRWRDVTPVVGDVVPPADVAAALGMAAGVEVLSRRRIFIVDDRRVQLATSYLPTELTRGTRIEHSNTGPGGVYARLGERGLAPTRFAEHVIGRAPSPDEVEELALRRSGAMVFEITRLAWSGDRCVEVTRMVLDAEAYELVYEFPA